MNTVAKNKPEKKQIARSGANGIRTRDLFHAMEARYQLRHSPKISSHYPPEHYSVEHHSASQRLENYSRSEAPESN